MGKIKNANLAFQHINSTEVKAALDKISKHKKLVAFDLYIMFTVAEAARIHEATKAQKSAGIEAVKLAAINPVNGKYFDTENGGLMQAIGEVCSSGKFGVRYENGFILAKDAKAPAEKSAADYVIKAKVQDEPKQAKGKPKQAKGKPKQAEESEGDAAEIEDTLAENEPAPSEAKTEK